MGRGWALQPQRRRSATIIEVQNLTKKYGTTAAVDDVSFAVRPGVITGFLGPNGAGKSTTMRAIRGSTGPESALLTEGARS